ncbi:MULTISPECIES: hypothetical protein [Pseudomonas]|uniref:Uncharacterized protein n=4 Tax=Pseudomonas lactis TaxID=1615674 RepID=A0ABS9FVM3_9PSED|nr:MULTISPECIES: hypothetical protein [Pseudomonas]MBI6978351.1 hypothetical protein [Pseudomonas lactis]MCF4976542.1 hypothetical protein [Pseudomonas lactis]MCF5004572.1 hypothetical protein [Pseudomonas lactis]MCF5010187.1 hypothetical protein [Pseudomonas lactis]MCF5015021.1 hypothetical protein [Pseudomonas lactis]
MKNFELKKATLRNQIFFDPLKILAVTERTTVVLFATFLVFLLIKKIGLTDSLLTGGIISGTLGSLIITLKTMYYDEALSELVTPDHVTSESVRNALFTLGYSETKKGIFSSPRKLFSFFYKCKSENITHTIIDNKSNLIGPYRKLLKLANSL